MKIDQCMNGYDTSSRYEVEIIDGNSFIIDITNLLSVADKVWIDFYFPAYRYGLVYQLKYLREYSPRAHTLNCAVLSIDSRSVDDYTMTRLCRRIIEPNLDKHLKSYTRYFMDKYGINLLVEVENSEEWKE